MLGFGWATTQLDKGISKDQGCPRHVAQWLLSRQNVGPEINTDCADDLDMWWDAIGQRFGGAEINKVGTNDMDT